MLDFALLALIMVAMLAGYLLGRIQKKTKDCPKKQLSTEYFVELNYLLHEKTDEVIETCIKALDLNNDTLDIYLALGNLFCCRGEVDKSIRVHENLLARPSLTPTQAIRVQLELAKDYISAGLFDRAEDMLIDLSRQNHQYRIEVLQQLLKIYEQEKEWKKAIEITELLCKLYGNEYITRLSHFYCEMAENYLKTNDYFSARKMIYTAFLRDKDCVRASLLLGRMKFEEGKDRDAIKVLQKISKQDDRYVPLSLDLLQRICHRSGNQHTLETYLWRCLNARPSTAVVLAMTAMLINSRKESTAMNFLISHLRSNPSLEGLNALINIQLSYYPSEQYMTSIHLLKEIIDHILDIKPIYQCDTCGFSGKEMHWHCPVCNGWGTIAPVHEIEGE